MPELPEVEYVRRILRPAMDGAWVDRVLLRRQALRYPFDADFARRLQGQRVRSVGRRAKYLTIDLASGDTLVMHLGMSGWFRVVRPRRLAAAMHPRHTAGDAGLYHQRPRLDAHDHVVFEMSNGAVVIYNDPRRFGFMKLLTTRQVVLDRALASLGPEPLGAAFSPVTLAQSLEGKRTSIKAALLDQRIVAGLGNIYACEALHRARLSPRRRASALATATGAPRPVAVALAAAIQRVLRDAIARSHSAGANDRFLVYDREGERCRRRACTGTIRRIVQAGRSTFSCPVCQR